MVQYKPTENMLWHRKQTKQLYEQQYLILYKFQITEKPFRIIQINQKSKK